VTTTIPIVFVGGLDPVEAGLVASLNRPGGNVTGVTFIGASLGAKRLELARELVPNVGIIALLTHPNSPDAQEELRDLSTAANAIGQELLVVSATSDRDFEAAFASIVQHRAGALLIGQDPFLFQAGGQLVSLAARNRIPAIYGNNELVSAGALISYGASLPDAWRLAGVYAGRILKGTKPGDLPVVQPTKFGLGINLQQARALGLDVPATLLARADEVIEWGAASSSRCLVAARRLGGRSRRTLSSQRSQRSGFCTPHRPTATRIVYVHSAKASK